MKITMPATTNSALVRQLLPVLALVSSFAVIGVVILPQAKNFSQLRAEKKTVDAQLTQLKEQSSRLRVFSASLPQLRTAMENLTRALPTEAAVPTFMNQIQKIAEANNVGLQSLSYSGGVHVAGETLSTVALQCTVNGSFDNVTKFLLALESSSRLVDVLNVNLSINYSSKTASLSLPLQGYYYDAPVVTDATTPITLDTTSADYKSVMEQVNSLKYFDTPVDVKTGIGKTDPFSNDEIAPPSTQEEASPSSP